jgi:hypothetical protein
MTKGELAIKVARLRPKNMTKEEYAKILETLVTYHRDPQASALHQIDTLSLD